MSIAYKLDSLDGLDDAMKSLYVSKDGKFVLDVDDTGAKSAIQKERERADAAEKALKERDGKEAQAQRDAEEAKARAAGDFDKLKASVEAEKQAALKREADAVTGLKAYLLKAEITSAIASAKGNPLLEKLIADQFEAVISPDGAHKVLVKGDPAKTPAQFVESLKADAAYGAFFEGSGVSGGGALPSAGRGNANASAAQYFDPKSPNHNLTKQYELAKTDPKGFAALREQFPTQE